MWDAGSSPEEGLLFSVAFTGETKQTFAAKQVRPCGPDIQLAQHLVDAQLESASPSVTAIMNHALLLGGQAAFLETLAKSLGVSEAQVQIAALRMQSARAAESHLRIARHLSAQVRGTLLAGHIQFAAVLLSAPHSSQAG